MKTRYKIYFKSVSLECASDKPASDVVHDLIDAFRKGHKKHLIFQIPMENGCTKLINLNEVLYIDILPNPQSRGEGVCPTS